MKGQALGSRRVVRSLTNVHSKTPYDGPSKYDMRETNL